MYNIDFFLSFKLSSPVSSTSYDHIRKFIGLDSLQTRRIKAHVWRLFKNLNRFDDCPQLLSSLGFRAVPRLTRESTCYKLL